ncbi:MAG TPA: hypothetical protein VFR84_01950 [Candidatus Angelobacter sp.]|nr:hypothetical protein [Candidatus Angelobacter sp.]
MAGHSQTGRKQLLQAVKRELGFFDAKGYGRSFRSQWRPTLLLRDSPVCVNYSSTGRQHACSECPLFMLVPQEKQSRPVPCHHIPLDASGVTVSELYCKGTQSLLDQRYRDWLSNLIRDFERP